jgi:hypothetical protein
MRLKCPKRDRRKRDAIFSENAVLERQNDRMTAMRGDPLEEHWLFAVFLSQVLARRQISLTSLSA